MGWNRMDTAPVLISRWTDGHLASYIDGHGPLQLRLLKS